MPPGELDRNYPRPPGEVLIDLTLPRMRERPTSCSQEFDGTPGSFHEGEIHLNINPELSTFYWFSI